MINYNLFITAAASVAKRLHANQKDKSGAYYFEGHLTAVASQGRTWLEKIAGYLHDASEDTPHSVEEVLNFLEEEAKAELPLYAKEELATALYLLDCHTAPSREEYIVAIGKHFLATAVKLNDSRNNMEISRLSAPTEKDLNRVKRYQSEYSYLTPKYAELRKLRILFVHGYNSGAFGFTATELQHQLGKRAVIFAPAFSNGVERFENILANIRQAQTLIDYEGIDLVVGSSMGGFTTLRVKGVPRIIINPCMKPSEQFDKLELVSTTDEDIAKYAELEQKLAPTKEEEEQTWALFADEDELFSYKTEFQNLFGMKNCLQVPGGHRNNSTRVKEHIIPLIDTLLENGVIKCK